MYKYEVIYKNNGSDESLTTPFVAKNFDDLYQKFDKVYPASAILNYRRLDDVFIDQRFVKDVANVMTEIKRQDKLWGADRVHDLFVWNTILGEEVGEVNKAVLEYSFNNASLQNYREEIVQVIAVCFQMLNSTNIKENE